MPDAPLDAVRAEVDRLHARVSELEAELARLREGGTASPGPEDPASAPAPCHSHERHRQAALQGRVFAWERDEERGLVEVDPSLFEWLGYEPRTGWLPAQDLA